MKTCFVSIGFFLFSLTSAFGAAETFPYGCDEIGHFACPEFVVAGGVSCTATVEAGTFTNKAGNECFATLNLAQKICSAQEGVNLREVTLTCVPGAQAR